MNPAIIKLPLLVLNLLLARRAGTSPTPPPQPDEKNGYEWDQNTREVSWFMKYFVPLRINLSTFIDLVEIYIILSQSIPTLRIFLPNSLLPLHTSSDLYFSQTFLFGSILLYIGALIRIVCYHYLGRHFTFHMTILKNHSLITTGPYSIVRHPSYTGMIIFLSGMAIAQMSSGSWLSEYVVKYGGFGGRVSVLGYLVGLGLLGAKLIERVPVEDLVLRKEFGEQWADWAKSTPYRLIPGVY